MNTQSIIRHLHLFAFAGVILFANCLYGQGGGFAAVQGGAGAYNGYQQQPQIQHQAPVNASDFISVRGSSEIAVVPESLRLVFAVTSDSETSNGCVKAIEEAIKSIRAELAEMKIEDKKVVEDFIVIVPTFTWELDQFDKAVEKSTYLKEKQDGFRMQTNLHVLCENELQANEVMKVAFKYGVNEVISFDYWHSKLDELKQEATKKALQAAKAKSEILLSVFDERPVVLNVDTSSSVSFPESQYKTINPPVVQQEAIVPYRWREYLKLKAPRPLTTFYAGSKSFADVTNGGPPMNPEIMISASVTLIYDSPARAQRMTHAIEVAKASAKSDSKE